MGKLMRTIAATSILLTGAAVLPGVTTDTEAQIKYGEINYETVTPEQLDEAVKASLAEAQKYLDEITGRQGERNIENTFVPLNRLSMIIDAAANMTSLMENVHPNAEVREAAATGRQEVEKFVTDLSLNREVYISVRAVDVAKADAVTKRLKEHMLRDYRRSGVDKDDETRDRIKALNEEIVEIGQEFDKNIRDNDRYIMVDGVEALEGLPEDFINSHQPDENGKIKLTTQYPDVVPTLQYAVSPQVKKDLYLEFTNRAFPANREVLMKLIAKRDELAKTLGYKNWGDYMSEDKMVKSADNIKDFIAKLDMATKARGEKDMAMLLAAKSKDVPGATEILDWERRYYSNKVKEENFDFNPQELRPYFNYPQVKEGMLTLTANLFGVRFEPAPQVTVWHEDVEAYNMFEGDKFVGRFFLDMFPREGKFSHAAQFTIQRGVKGFQVPTAALVCNFPKPDENGVALMEHDQVETFLHEFGHLLHTLFSGEKEWNDQSGISTEWDFAEAPSQMLEEWSLDLTTLQTFAKNYQTGEPIPAELVAKLRASKDFGNGVNVRQQNFYTAISYNCYSRNPANIDLDKMVPELQKKYSPYTFVPGSHMYASFGHLEGYSVMYYTYMWSLVIAKDMFSKFDKNNMLDPGVATEYRKKVLAPGGTKDAADLVADFLGRPYGFESFENWITGEQPN